MRWLRVALVVNAVGSVAAQAIGLVLLFRVVLSHGSLLEMGSALGWTAFAHGLYQAAEHNIKSLKGTGEAR